MEQEKIYTDSKVVSKLNYNSETQILEVTYTSGAKWKYFDFPEQMFLDAIKEKSIGSFIHRVKNHYRSEPVA